MVSYGQLVYQLVKICVSYVGGYEAKTKGQKNEIVPKNHYTRMKYGH